ncbi:MAG: DUF523 domain-containing protein [Ruminococcaceae bacterium]|nr:DUF523 domain-containing protein [Oscillospiraceae bacterium]
MEKIIVSACLLGVATRYDGKSKKVISDEDLKSLSEKYHIIPVCPEIYGGLSTPRIPSERIGDRVKMKDGRDVTENYIRGAYETLAFCRMFDVKKALLKAKSPSCSKRDIYDGSFTGKLVNGKGVAAELLIENGIEVFDETEIKELLSL